MSQQQYPSVSPVGPACSQGAKLSFLTREAVLPPGPSSASEPTFCVSRLYSVHLGLQRVPGTVGRWGLRTVRDNVLGSLTFPKQKANLWTHLFVVGYGLTSANKSDARCEKLKKPELSCLTAQPWSLRGEEGT